MQNGQIRLKEIIWEITGACNNNCDYCGSKNVSNVINDQQAIDIAGKIIRYAPKEINISGGDPLLLSYETHNNIVDLFKLNKIVCKIIINPKSIASSTCTANSIRKHPKTTLKLYDWIGISVNDEKELKILSENWFSNTAEEIFEKSTIITNFNVANLFLFDKICSFVKQNNMTWQIQYTMYKEKSNPMSVCENESASEFLFKKINDAMDGGVKIVVADNMTASPCSAGISSLGILFDGSVVPCLSMRSWMPIEGAILGNLIDKEWKSDDKNYDAFAENPLKYIWEHRFHEQRFGSFKCCKDYCNNKCFVRSNLMPKGDEDKMSPITGWKSIKNPPDRMILYGVAPELGKTFVYGVTREPIVSVYAVTTYPCDFDNISSTTVTGDLSKTTFQKPKNNNKKE